MGDAQHRLYGVALLLGRRLFGSLFDLNLNLDLRLRLGRGSLFRYGRSLLGLLELDLCGHFTRSRLLANRAVERLLARRRTPARPKAP